MRPAGPSDLPFLRAMLYQRRAGDPARLLYERLGFVRAGGTGAWTMRLDLSRPS